MSGHPERSYSAEVITTYVWDAIKDIPGVGDFHRGPLQTLGEKVHLERLAPVHLEHEDGHWRLEVHLVVRPQPPIPETAAAVEQAVRTYLDKMAGLTLDAVDIYIDDLADEQPGGE